jgi:Tol biopolymer transport system component
VSAERSLTDSRDGRRGPGESPAPASFSGRILPGVRAPLLLLLALASLAIPGTAAGRTTRPASRYLVTAAGIGSQRPPVIEILDATGRVERVVAHPGSIQSLDARWSPDGSMLAWSGNGGVSVENADGSGRRLVVRPAKACSTAGCTGFSFAWSPDSRALAVAEAGFGARGVLTVSLSTGRRVEIASPSPSTNDFVIGWSPDGRSLVYERSSGNSNSPSCCRLDVRVATADGRHTRVAYRFADPFYRGSFPSLAPDGRTMAYMTPSDDGRSDLIRVVALRSGASHEIRGLGVLMDTAPAWSPDSRRFAIARLSGQAITVAPDGTHLHALGTRGSNVYWGRSGRISVVHGTAEDQVWTSGAGEPARFLFRVPGKLGIAALDAP